MDAPRKGAGRDARPAAATVLRAVLCGVLAFSIVAGGAAIAAPGPARRGRPGRAASASRRPLPPPTTANSSWSGELAWAANNGVTAFDHVTGAWVQPSVAAAAGAQYADTWVGIDGYDGKLLQAGTTASTRDGSVSYDAWFVAWTGGTTGMTVLDEPVAPGDHMKVAINRTASGDWSVAVTDATAGWTWTTVVAYPAAGSTAEWIEEAPATWSTLSTDQTLADYGSVQFTTVEADGKAPAHVTAFEITASGAVISSPSTYDAARGSFDVHYGSASAPRTLGATAGPPVVSTVYGLTADGTAAAELTRAFPYEKGSCPPTRAAVLATTREYEDALSSQFLAQALTTGTLLTPTSSLSSVTAATLEDEGVATVYIVGGPLAVSTTVARAIESLPADACGGSASTSSDARISVHRIAGATAYATAMDVADFVGAAGVESFPGAYSSTNATGGTGRYNDTAGLGTQAPAGTEPTAILASSSDFEDAEAASVISYHTKLPLLLTASTTLSATAVAAIERLGVGQVILLGGTNEVSNTVEGSLVEETGVSVLRVAGQSPTDTAIELAELETAGTGSGLAWTPGQRMVVSRGDDVTDGLAGAVLENTHNTATGAAGTARPLLLLAGPTEVGASLTTFLRVAGRAGIDATAAKTITGLTVLGGPLAVSSASISALESALGS